MNIEFVTVADDAEATVAVLVFEGAVPSAEAETFDRESDGAVARALSGRFRGAAGTSAVAGPRILLIGAGPRDSFDEGAAEIAAATAFHAAEALGAAVLLLRLPPLHAAHAALGVRLAAYRFDRYKTVPDARTARSVRTVRIAAIDPDAMAAAFAPLAALADGIEFARDVISEPANVLHPVEFAHRLQALARPGLSVEVLGEDQIAALGMGALLGVGLGSVRDTQLVILQWKGDPDPAAAPVAFVGKGVTFDTGGVSIKQADGMEDMKWDMGGAGVIAGMMLALARRNAAVNVVGVLGLVENMVDGAAQRPGDIVTSMSGQTIEVINTDAEGRLVLADALWYCQQRFHPRAMIDVATLTGAIMIALGSDYGGLYCEDDGISDALLAAGIATGEELWRMPMPASYDRHIDSLAADVKNVAVGIGRLGGASIAARFLRRFTNDTPWAHLDISSPTWRSKSVTPTAPAGATGYGVRLLERFVRDGYEAN